MADVGKLSMELTLGLEKFRKSVSDLNARLKGPAHAYKPAKGPNVPDETYCGAEPTECLESPEERELRGVCSKCYQMMLRHTRAQVAQEVYLAITAQGFTNLVDVQRTVALIRDNYHDAELRYSDRIREND